MNGKSGASIDADDLIKRLDAHLDRRFAQADADRAAGAVAERTVEPQPVYPLKRLAARVLALEGLALEIAFELLKKVPPADRAKVLARAVGRGKKLMNAMPQPGNAIEQKHYQDAAAHLDFYATRFAQELLDELEQEGQ
jgi:hypothetical protein